MRPGSDSVEGASPLTVVELASVGTLAHALAQLVPDRRDDDRFDRARAAA